MLSCVEIDGKDRLKSLPIVNCREDPHLSLSKILFLPGLLQYSLIFPLLIFYYISKSRNNLDDE